MSANLLQLSAASKSFGQQVVFDDAFLSVNEGEHVGVIGPNGAGKSTLFKALIGEQDLDSGSLVRSRNLSLAYLSQHDLWSPEETGNDYVARTSSLPLWQVKSMGRDLQVSEEVFAKPIVSLSGGYRMRIKLIGLLGLDPNLMLLDEPTNYLDLETTLLLERFLQNFRGAFMLISHDREFLRRTTDHTIEVESGEITKYNGNIDDYFEQKEMLREQLAAQARSQAEKRKTIQEFVDRFGAKATKARQAQSRLKALQKMEEIEARPVPVRAVIQIPKPAPVGKMVLRIEHANFGYGEVPVIRNTTLEVRRGDHVAVVGLNGAGKSTLLKGIAGTLAPLAGKRELGHQVRLAIFNQHVVEILDHDQTVLESLEGAASSEVTSQEIRNMAGSLLFSNDHIYKKVAVLSGGEKSRVALGQILLKKVPFLLLDEPTNHLDFQTVEALTQALQSFEGSLVVVSHDRGFIRRVANQILEVSNGKVSQYPGTYDEYVWSLQKSLSAQAGDEGDATLESKSESPSALTAKSKASANSPSVAAMTTPKRAESYHEMKERSKRLRMVEKKLAACELEITETEKEIAQLNEAAVNHPETVIATVQKLSEKSLRLQALETEWARLGEELVSLQASE